MVLNLLSGLRQIVSAGLWLWGGLMILWLIGRHLPVDQTGLILLADALMPWLGVSVALLALLALSRRHYYLAMWLGLPAFMVGLIIAPLFLPRFTSPPPHRLSLKVMSFNLWNNDTHPEIMAKARLIREQKPDVLLMQEAEPQVLQKLRIALPDLYDGAPIYQLLVTDTTQAIWSRYPLHELPDNELSVRRQSAELETPEGRITIWNIHAYRANFIPYGGPNFLSYDNLELHVKAKNQFNPLIEALMSQKQPLILGGDFNLPTQAADYRALTEYLNEAQWQAGWGFGFTYPATVQHGRNASLLGYHYKLRSPMPLARLDHLFYSSHFFAMTATTLPDSAGSDHIPVVAELWLK